jgi:hypothetical protein
MVETTSMVLIKAICVHNYGNGIVGIEMPARILSDEEQNTLHNLFPHLVDKVYNLLSQEALLNSLHTGPLPESLSHDVIECNKRQESNGVKKKSKFKDTLSNPVYPEYEEEKLPPNSY